MSNKIDKIVSTFTKTVDKLKNEAARLGAVSVAASDESNRLAAVSQDADLEAERADRIAAKLEGLLNG